MLSSLLFLTAIAQAGPQGESTWRVEVEPRDDPAASSLLASSWKAIGPGAIGRSRSPSG